MNPVEEIIQKLKDREIHTSKGGNIRPMVFLDDALEALQELEVKIWLMCEEEKQREINRENY